MKIQRIISAFALAFVMIVIQYGSAFAKPDSPDCRITASTTTPVVGEPVQLTVKTSLTGSVYFGDGTEVQNGKSLWHTFHYVGSPVAVAAVWVGRSTVRCTFDFTVSDGPKPAGKPDDDSGNIQDQTEVNAGSETTYAHGSIEGDNNIAPVINGDNNKVIVKIEQPAPLVETIEPKPLTFGQKFWLPWKTFWRGVVAILVGWFDLNIP